MDAFNPLKGLAVMLGFFLVYDFVFMNGRQTWGVLRYFGLVY